MKVGTILFSMLLMFAAGKTAFAACDTTLKPTDDYRVLAGKLECLNRRIAGLEKLVGSGSSTAPRLPLNKSVSIKGGKLTAAIEKCAWSQSTGDLFCAFIFQNQTVEDQKLCLGAGSRLTTDTNRSFSNAGWYTANVGSKQTNLGPYNSGDQVCDIIPPMTRAEAWLRFNGSKAQANSKVQFVRLDCGTDCKVDAFDVEIK